MMTRDLGGVLFAGCADRDLTLMITAYLSLVSEPYNTHRTVRAWFVSVLQVNHHLARSVKRGCVIYPTSV